MKRIRYLTLLVLLLGGSIGIAAQNSDFNPVSPDEPAPPGGLIRMLTLVAEPSDGGSVNGAGWYETGSKLTLRATNNTNYAFSHWTNEKGETLSAQSQFLYTKLSGNETLTAHFRFSPGNPAEPDEIALQLYYLLTLQATDGGTVSGGGKYQPGTSVYLSASASTGYTFAGWYDEAGQQLSTETGYYYTTGIGTTTLTACFRFDPSAPDEPVTPAPTHRVTATATDGGAVNVSANKVAEGANVYLQATPNASYVFTGWYANGKLYSSESYLTYTMGTSDIAFEARFVFNPTAPGDPSMPSTKKYAFYLLNRIARPGTTVDFPVYLTSLDSVANLSFQLTFDPALRPDMTSAALSKEAKGYNMDITALDDTTYVFTFAGSKRGGGDMPLLTLNIAVPEGIATARGYQVKINQVAVTDLEGTVTTASTRNGRVSVYKLGDTNGDDRVDLMDKMNLTATLLGETPEVFIEEMADINGDGLIDNSDATALLEMCKVSGDTPAEPTDADSIYIESLRVEAGVTALRIAMRNPSADIWACAFDILLPQGMAFDTAHTPFALDYTAGRFPKVGNAYTHSVAYDSEHQEGSWWRVIIDTDKEERIRNAKGSILTAYAKMTKSMATGNYPIRIKNVLMVVDGTHSLRPAESVYMVEVKDGTVGIQDVASQRNQRGECYDLAGRRWDSRSLNRKGVYIVDGKKVVR